MFKIFSSSKPVTSDSASTFSRKSKSSTVSRTKPKKSVSIAEDPQTLEESAARREHRHKRKASLDTRKAAEIALLSGINPRGYGSSSPPKKKKTEKVKTPKSKKKPAEATKPRSNSIGSTESKVPSTTHTRRKPSKDLGRNGTRKSQPSIDQLLGSLTRKRSNVSTTSSRREAIRHLPNMDRNIVVTVAMNTKTWKLRWSVDIE